MYHLADHRDGLGRAFSGRRRLATLIASVALVLIVAVVAAFTLRLAHVQAQTCGTAWTNASGGDWSVAGNWSAGVPTATTDACITLPGSYSVTLSVRGDTQSLTLGGSGSTPTLRILGTSGDVSEPSLNVASELTNNGTINILGRVSPCCYAVLRAGSGVTNNGTIALGSVQDGPSAVLASSTLTNNGTITTGANGFESTNVIRADIVNSAGGTIGLNQYTHFSKSGATYTNLGTISVAAGALLSLTAVTSGPTFNQNGGTLTLNGGFGMFNGGSFVFNGGAISGQPVRLGDVALTLNTPNAASFELVGQHNTLSGDVSAGQTLNLVATTFPATLTAWTGFTNNGTITLDSTATSSMDASLFVFSGTLVNTGTLTVGGSSTAGVRSLAAQLDNYGSVITYRDTTLQSPNATPVNEAGGSWEVAAGTLTLPQQGSPASLSNQGTLLIDPGATLAIPSGSLSNTGPGLLLGSGTVAASVSNDGFIGPGSADGSGTGILTIQGSYSQSSSGTLYLELCGTTAGSGYDRLTVTGSASLAGTLLVTNTNPTAVCYTPLLNDSFRVLTMGAHSGDFVQPYWLPPLDPGLAWSTNLSATFLDLTVLSGAAPSAPQPSARPVPARPRLPQRS